MSIVHDHDGGKPKDSEHKHDNCNHDETSEFLDNSDTIEFENDITTTISPEKETTTDLELEEIAFDDSEAYFQEDFGTLVSDQGQAIFDPLDDIADVDKVHLCQILNLTSS